MLLKRTLLKKSRLYVIIDLEVTPPADAYRLARNIVKAKPDIIQLRAKRQSSKAFLNCALEMRKIIPRKKIIFIVNDSADIAGLCGSDGVHLGQDDLPIRCARILMGNGKIIGKSVNNIKEALSAQREGADYVALGPIFSTPTKPAEAPLGIGPIKMVKDKLKIPLVVIGGINQNNISGVLNGGPDIVCLSRAVSLSKNPSKAIIDIKRCISAN